MRRDYNKLVRDHIPFIIQKSDKHCAFENMPEAECRQALLEKLVEETQEARQAASEELVSELADIQEVLTAVLAAWQITPVRVKQMKRQRFAELGDFERQLMLLWTEDGDENA